MIDDKKLDELIMNDIISIANERESFLMSLDIDDSNVDYDKMLQNIKNNLKNVQK